MNEQKIYKAPNNQVAGDHYSKLQIQPWDCMSAWFPGSFDDYLLMNALKYIARQKLDKVEDIAKARHYLDEWLRRQDV